MGFGQELKDFAEGFKSGTDIADRRETARLNRERFGKPTEADIECATWWRWWQHGASDF